MHDAYFVISPLWSQTTNDSALRNKQTIVHSDPKDKNFSFYIRLILDMAVANHFHARHEPVYDDDYDDYDYDYDDYDDFAIHISRGGGGTAGQTNSQTKDIKHKGKSKHGRSHQQHVYSSKHVRAKDSLRARRKGTKGKALTTNRKRFTKERNPNGS
jgi:hypothetical protein